VSIVKVEHSAETLSAPDRPLVVHRRGDEEGIVESLMISLSMVVLDELAQDPAQMPFAERR
jgi:hypothetical protein